jgi:hypothetical protein
VTRNGARGHETTTILRSTAVETSLPVGTHVEVANRYAGGWCRGFEVADVTARGYRVRRVTDRWVLPAEFASDALRVVSAGPPRPERGSQPPAGGGPERAAAA